MRPDDFKDLIGIPFSNVGRDIHTGLDCWGLCREAMKRCGLDVPPFEMACYDALAVGAIVTQEGAAGNWLKVDTPSPGDLVLMEADADAPGVCQHVGVYIGSGLILHTIKGRDSHTIKTDNRFWRRKMRGFYRWIGRT